MAGWKKKCRKKRAVELEGRKRESTLKFHDGFLSRYRPERERMEGKFQSWEESERKEKEWERCKLFSQDSSTPHISHSPRSCHITIGLIYYSFCGQDRTRRGTTKPSWPERKKVYHLLQLASLLIMTCAQKKYKGKQCDNIFILKTEPQPCTNCLNKRTKKPCESSKSKLLLIGLDYYCSQKRHNSLKLDLFFSKTPCHYSRFQSCLWPPERL